MKKMVIVLILAAIYGIAVYTRVSVVEYQKAVQGPLPFTLESALLFRYADMAAKGEPIPENDLLAQFPEGLRVRERLPIAQEPIMGWIHRHLLGRYMDLHDSIRLLSALFFSTAVFAVFLACRALSKDTLSGLAAALLYAVAFPAVIRSTGQEIMAENAALPLLFFHIAFFLLSFDESCGTRARSAYAAASSLTLACALAAWDMVQVYLYILVVGYALYFVLSRDPRSAGRSFLLCMTGVVAVCLFNPYLRWHQVAVSYPLAASYALCVGTLAALILKKEMNFSWKLSVVVLSCLSVAAAWYFFRYHTNYSHFAQLLFYKIRFLNSKPADPALLPYEVRSLWVPALQSVTAWEILRYFSITIVLAGACFLYAAVDLFRGRLPASWLYVLLLTAAFALLYILFYRMVVFLSFFVCLLSGASVAYFKRRAGRAAWGVWALFVAACVVFEADKTYASVGGMGRYVDYPRLKDVVSWVKGNTPDDSVVLATFTVSPSILAYADRAIVIHPKYEDPAMRDKVRAYDLSILGESEEDFFRFCNSTGATHYIHSRGTYSDRSINGRRYLAGVMRPSIHTNAYKFEVAPERLTRFRKLYDNGKYIVCAVVMPSDISEAGEICRAAASFARDKQYADAAAAYRKALVIDPARYEAYRGLIAAYAATGDTGSAAQAAQELFRKLGVRKADETTTDQ
ncbi:MAG TPA: hypothetical protein P5287_00020 [bacterium]|nr:hypothetical protein [bacterium]